ncbi:MAG: aldo/keto reductase [Eubacteriales bacterium]
MIPKRNCAGNDCSLLGFGCMRLPLTQERTIDLPRAEKMIDIAYASGINYFDTAYFYLNSQSEPFVGHAMKKYPRHTFHLATKLPPGQVKTKADAQRILEDQLKKLQTDYIDYYLLHALNADSWKRMLEVDILPVLVDFKRQGLIRKIGFSFHDEYPVFESILTAFPWDFCQIQFNYMDTEVQAGLRGLQLAESRGIPVVVMEPIRGGGLVHYPDDIKQAFAELNPRRNLANWALSYVASYDNVKVLLSGMSTVGQLRDNLRTFRHFQPLSREEMQGVGEIVTKIRQKMQNACTGCRYCMPCPAGVNIPRAFQIWNESAMHGNAEVYRKNYLAGKPASYASSCRECGACEPQCPQQISIIEDLKKVKALFENT